MVCFETAEAEVMLEDIQLITAWADSIVDEDEYVLHAPTPSWVIMDVTVEAAEDPEPSPSVPERAEIPAAVPTSQISGHMMSSKPQITEKSTRWPSNGQRPVGGSSPSETPSASPGASESGKNGKNRWMRKNNHFSSQRPDTWRRETSTRNVTPASPPLKESTSKTLKSRVPPAPAAAQRTAVVQKRVFRDGWTTRKVWQKTSVKPPVTTDPARHPSKQERQKEKSESLLPPAPASVPNTAPSQSQEIGGQETATKPVVTPASPPQSQPSAWGTPLPQGQRSFWDTFPPQLQRQRDKPETLVSPAPADVPRAAPSQSEEINGQETSTKPITPPSPPQNESSAQRLDEPDPVKSETLVPPADAADPITAPSDAVDTPKVSKKPRRRQRKMANAPSQSEEINGQETPTKPITPPSPPQKESCAQRLDEPDPVKPETLVSPAPADVPRAAPSQSEEINGQETSTKPITPPSPPQNESSAQRLDEPDPVKSETLVPPADAADPITAPSDAVDTPKVSKKPRRRQRKMANAPSQNQGIGGQETSTATAFTPPSPPQKESSTRLDEPDPVKSEPLVPPVDAADQITVLRKQEIDGEEAQRQEASDTGTSVEDLCERLEKVYQSSKPPARATQAPVPELHHLGLNSSSPFDRLNPLRPAKFLFDIPSTFDPIENSRKLLEEVHLSSKPPATPRPSPVPENHLLGLNSSSPFNPLKPLRPATFIFKLSPNKLLEEEHLSSKPPATPRPSPVPENHLLGLNSSSPFNPLKPLRPATFIFKSSTKFGLHSSSPFNPLKPLRPATFIFKLSPNKLLEEEHLSSKPPATPRPSPVPELHHIGSSDIHGASSFNRLKPLCPAKCVFESPSAFGFGPKSQWQMSGQGRSVEPPVTEDPRTTPSVSQADRSALKPENHAPAGYVFAVLPKDSKFITKEKRKMRKRDFQKRQEANSSLETVEHLFGLKGLHLFTKSPEPATPSSVPH